MTNRVFRGIALAFLCSGMMVGCGGSNATTPNPVPTPAPTPVPTPTPTPNPGSIGAFACKLPPGTNKDAALGLAPCPVLPPRLGDFVNAAIDKAEKEHPELFNFNDMNGPSPRVLDKAAYHRTVAENLVQAGVCTVIEIEELAVKNTNDFNEQWNIYTSGGFVRRKYVTTCVPAWF